MKNFILILCTICVNSISAQDYQNICTPGTTLYQSGSAGLKAFRMDSVYPLPNNDTMFISYRTIRMDIPWNCLDTTNGSVLGRKILKSHTGWFCFFNAAGDSVRLNTQAALNESWKFCGLPGNSYIQAMVTGIIDDSVLGTIDQVKVISFQAKNSSNVNITHALNMKSIRLSQHHGLSQMLDVFFIPDDTTDYFLAGKTDPVAGLQDITWQQIYNFDVGDEFHFRGIDVWINSHYYLKYEIFHVLAKTSYGNDSVSYSMEYCRLDSTLYPTVVTKVHDTITVRYNFQQLTNDNASWFTRLPEEFFNQNDLACSYKSTFAYHDRQTKSVKFWDYMRPYYLPECWVGLGQPACWEIFQHENRYTEGLGSVYYNEDCYANNMHTHTKWNHLEYFKKGSETWGAPIALDCRTLTNTNNLRKKVTGTIHIAPDPVETESTIWLDTDIENEELQCFVTDYMGRKVAQFYMHSFPFKFNRAGIPDGMYILTISNKSGILIARDKLIIIN